MDTLKEQIREEHWRSELQRLRSGMDGCGCGECQQFYKTLDLSQFGSRVRRLGDIVTIVAGVTGADLMTVMTEEVITDGWYHTPAGEVYVTDGVAWQVKNVDGSLVSVAVYVNKSDLRKKEISYDGRDDNIKNTRNHRLVRTGRVRVRPTASTQLKPTDTRHIKARKRLSDRPLKPAKPRVSG